MWAFFSLMKQGITWYMDSIGYCESQMKSCNKYAWKTLCINRTKIVSTISFGKIHIEYKPRKISLAMDLIWFKVLLFFKPANKPFGESYCIHTCYCKFIVSEASLKQWHWGKVIGSLFASLTWMGVVQMLLMAVQGPAVSLTHVQSHFEGGKASLRYARSLNYFFRDYTNFFFFWDQISFHSPGFLWSHYIS